MRRKFRLYDLAAVTPPIFWLSALAAAMALSLLLRSCS
jgi:hypothetical protein